MSRYICPTTDFGFKKLFGEEANKDIIMSFIQDVIELTSPLKDIRFLDKEQLPEWEGERAAIYDIFCESEDGSKFIVEMQKSRLKFMLDRLIYYSTFPIVAQAKKGTIEVIENGEKKVLPWDYKLAPIYCIAILEFTLEENGYCVKRYSIRNDAPPHNIWYKKLKYITIELPLFDETKPEYNLEKHLNKWIYFIKYLPNLNNIPDIFKGEVVFQKAFSVAEVANYTPEERRLYELSLKRARDSYAAIEYAMERGRNEERKAMALSMLKNNEPIEKIEKYTNLTREEIEKLKNNDINSD